MHQVFSRENSFVIEVTFWGFSISETRRKAFDSLGGKLTLNLQLMKLNQECHGLGKRHKQKKTCSRPTYFLVIDVSLSQRMAVHCPAGEQNGWQCIAKGVVTQVWGQCWIGKSCEDVICNKCYGFNADNCGCIRSGNSATRLAREFCYDKSGYWGLLGKWLWWTLHGNNGHWK